MDYFNTNGESGATLTRSRLSAANQQAKVLAFFQENARYEWAAHEIHENVFGDATPLTSVRRAITNLADQGLITKTKAMCPGLFGKNVHTWILSTSEPQKAASLHA